MEVTASEYVVIDDDIWTQTSLHILVVMAPICYKPGVEYKKLLNNIAILLN
jgi:hypothetical protein